MEEQLEIFLAKINGGMDFVNGQLPDLAVQIIRLEWLKLFSVFSSSNIGSCVFFCRCMALCKKWQFSFLRFSTYTFCGIRFNDSR